MAYILPITHYDYYNYQKRIDSDKRDPFQIEALAEVNLNTKYQEQENYSEDIEQPKNKPLTLRRPTRPPEDLYARITGKGQDFNESV